MEHMLKWSNCSIFHDVFKNICSISTASKALSWGKGLTESCNRRGCGRQKSILHVNSLPAGNFSMFFCRMVIFSKSTFSKNSFRNTIRVSNSLDLDQAKHFVAPDEGPNCK